MVSVIYAAGGDSRNAGFFLRKELGEALRIGQNFKISVDLSSVASGDTNGRALRCSLSVCTANWSHTSEHILKERSDAQNIVSR